MTILASFGGSVKGGDFLHLKSVSLLMQLFAVNREFYEVGFGYMIEFV